MGRLRFSGLLGPLFCLVLIAVVLVLEQSGVKERHTASQPVFLPLDFYDAEPISAATESVIIFDSSFEPSIRCMKAISLVLDNMRIAHDISDTASGVYPKFEDYLHPDDLLDDRRGADKGWQHLKEKFEEYLVWLSNTAPGLRGLTAQQGAAAVERFDRLTVDREIKGDEIILTLGGFYDEAWLMLRLNTGEPARMEGGSFKRVCDDLYLIHAKTKRIVLYTKEAAP